MLCIRNIIYDIDVVAVTFKDTLFPPSVTASFHVVCDWPRNVYNKRNGIQSDTQEYVVHCLQKCSTNEQDRTKVDFD